MLMLELPIRKGKKNDFEKQKDDQALFISRLFEFSFQNNK